MRARLKPGSVAVLAGLCAAAAHADVQPPPDLIPLPAEVASQPGAFALRASVEVRSAGDARVRSTAAYFIELLDSSHGLSLRLRPTGVTPIADGAITFRLDPEASGTSPESYQLEVSPERVVVSAREPRGLFYGAVTLWQLCSARRLRDGALALPAVRIDDTPRFRWRGLMLDSARHFQKPEFILRYLDWMALHKLNVLGWHLTDDQAWRLEVKRFPRLTEVGAWRVPAGAAALRDIDPATHRPRLYGGYYTQEDVRRIVAHAAERNVTIVPEIEMPGHATAAIVAYPSLGVLATAPAAVPADWGIYPNLFNVEESTFDFIEHVLDELMALFPGEYVHTGGDEAVKDQWRASVRIQARMRELGVTGEEALQGYFTARIGKYLAAHGRRQIGWDEILEGGVPPDAAVMSWRGVEGAIVAAARGHDTVLSPAPTLYLDNRQGPTPAEPPGRGKVISLEDVYRFDPLPGPLARDRSHVLGIQANLWTEHVRSEADAAYMTWPRAAALAEVAWSPAALINWESFEARLAAEFVRYRTLGLRYSDDVFAAPRSVGTYERHFSQDLKTCSDKLVLNLEDDAPLTGPRAVFLVDIMDPCWIFPQGDLTHAASITAAVGQVPFNFQIGKDIEAIHLDAPRTPAGELEVRLDRCDGAPSATLPLAPAAGSDAVSVLPPAALPRQSGTHSLCLRFTQRTLDPLWTIDWVQLSQ
ncbi:MAG TPA: family 20 glycosylhydrolase [Steroidobacteraceae bacterium]|nr:family 20 glycosylhydrolase [Steroidobacteraceae bacterium]